MPSRSAAFDPSTTAGYFAVAALRNEPARTVPSTAASSSGSVATTPMPPVSSTRDLVGAPHGRAARPSCPRPPRPVRCGGSWPWRPRAASSPRRGTTGPAGHREPVRAEGVELGQQVGPARRRDAEHGHERGDADGDPEGGQRRAQPAGAQTDGAGPRVTSPGPQVGAAEPAARRRRPPSIAVIRSPRRSESSTTRPSSSDTHRGSGADSAASWVMSTMVEPAAVEVVERVDDLGAGVAVEVAGRLVGQHERRLADDGAGDGHPLALAARQLPRAVVHAVRRGRPARARRGRGPAAAAAARRRTSARRPRSRPRSAPR